MDTEYDFTNFENITIRKNYVSTSNESLKSFETSNSEYVARSLPDLSTLTNDDIGELQEEINLLKKQLTSAHAEIDNLSLENNSLKKQILEQKSAICHYKKIYSGSPDVKRSSRKKKINKTIENVSNLSPSPLNKSPELKLQFETPLKCSNSCEPPTQSHQNIGIVETSTCDNELISMSTDDAKVSLPQDPVGKDNINLCTIDGIQTTSTSTSMSLKRRNIFIMGTQQCKGLALKLIKERKNSVTKSQEYNITAQVKPFATSQVFHENMPFHSDSLADNNYVVLCVGENDRNPIKLLIDYSVILKKMCNMHVIVLSIFKNKYLNEYKLNSKLKILCNNFSNCTFINTTLSYLSKHMYLHELCHKINLIIDSKDYNEKYLTFKKKICKKSVNTSNVLYTRGTIPYYFPIISKKTNNCSRVNENSGETPPWFFREKYSKK